MLFFILAFFVTCHRKSCEIALKEKHLHSVSQYEDGTDEVSDSILEQLADLKLVFTKAAEDDKPTDVSFSVFVYSYYKQNASFLLSSTCVISGTGLSLLQNNS